MFKSKKTALATGLIAFAFSGALQASVSAMSMIEMSNFVAKGSNGVVLDVSDFQVLDFTSTADMDVALGAATDTFNNPGGATNTLVAPLCVGSCPTIADDAYPVISGPATTNYTTADLIENGAPITGLAGYGNPAHIANASYVGIATGSLAGSANSNNNLNASWTFQLAQATGITFEFDVRAYLEAFVSGTEVVPSFATAAYQFAITIVDLTLGTSILDFNPALLNGTASLNSLAAVDITNTAGKHAIGVATSLLGVSVPTVALNNTSLYQLSARINTNADASRVAVPEPSVIGLLGLGLLGAGFASRKKLTVV